MSSFRPGRNEPCPCGSNKKYKKCCLPADEAADAQARREAQLEEEARLDEDSWLDGSESALKSIVVARDFRESLDAIRAYQAKRPEIHAAIDALLPHRAKYLRLADTQPEAHQTRIQALFAEEMFDPLRWTVDDIERALVATGWAGKDWDPDETMDAIADTILFLASKEKRRLLAMSLGELLPRFVDRPVDGWIVASSAYETTEAPDAINPFLLQMFARAYEAWSLRQREQEIAFLREAGIDLDELMRLPPDQREARLKAQASDPRTQEKFEQGLHQNPELEKLAIKRLNQTAKTVIGLLERDEAVDLLIDPDDLAPWIPSIAEAMAPAEGALDPSSKLWPLLETMVDALFTPERLRQLGSDLRQLQAEFEAAGDYTAAHSAETTAAVVSDVDSDLRDRFLQALCVASINYHAQQRETAS